MTLTKDFTQKLYDDFASNAKYRAVENAVTKKWFTQCSGSSQFTCSKFVRIFN